MSSQKSSLEVGVFGTSSRSGDMYEGKEGVKLVWLEKICYKVLFTAAILIFNHCISFFVSFEQLFGSCCGGIIDIQAHIFVWWRID